MTSPRLRSVPAVPLFVVAVRVSRVQGRSGEAFHSPETQEASARRAVERAGGVVDETVGVRGVFYDLDVSGSVAPSDRPGLGAALELVRAGRIQGVAVHDLSRWSRDTVSGLRELEEVAALGGQVVTGSEHIDLATPGGVFATTVQLAAQQMRRAEAAKAWRETHQSRFDRGLPHGRLPVGYRSDGHGGAEPDPVLGPAVAEAFRDYAAGRTSQPQVAERLGRLRGRPMRQGVVSQLLRNDFYVGVVRYNGQQRKGRHQPLVDEVIWRAVQATLASASAARPVLNGGSGLSALLACGLCGAPLHRRGRGALRKDGQQTPLLKCSGRAAGCPGIGTPRLADLEAALLDVCAAIAAALPDTQAELADRNSDAARTAALVARLRAQVDGLTSDLGQAGALLARGVLSEAAYAATAGQLEQELAAARAGLLEAEGRAQARVMPAEEGRRAVQEMRELWPFMLGREKHVEVSRFLVRAWLLPAAYRGQAVAERLRWAEVGQDEERVWLPIRS